MADVVFSHNGPKQIQPWRLRRSELFTVTHQVGPLNCLPGGDVCYRRLPRSQAKIVHPYHIAATGITVVVVAQRFSLVSLVRVTSGRPHQLLILVARRLSTAFPVSLPRPRPHRGPVSYTHLTLPTILRV